MSFQDLKDRLKKIEAAIEQSLANHHQLLGRKAELTDCLNTVLGDTKQAVISAVEAKAEDALGPIGAEIIEGVAEAVL